MKNFVCVFILGIGLLNGCSPTGRTTIAPATQTAENKSSAAQISLSNADAAEPAIAADASGNLYVLYVEHGADKTANVFLQKFDSQLKAIGEKARVNPQTGEATAWRGDAPTIVVAADGGIYVGWTKRVEAGSGSANDLCLSVSRDGGKSFAAPVKVNDDKIPAVHGMHSLAIDKNNSIYFAWLDERFLKNGAADKPMPKSAAENEAGEMKHQHSEPNREIYFTVSRDSGKSFAPNKKLAGEVCPCCKTSLVVAADGRLYVSWRQVLTGDFRHIAVASSNDAGENFSAPKIVSDDRWQISACPVCGAAMKIDEKNTLKIIWFTAGSAGKPGLYEAESSNFGATFSDRVLISETMVFGTPNFIAGADEKFTAVWESNGKLFKSQSQTNDNFTEAQIIGDGNLPSAVSVDGKIFTAFIKKESDKRAVWLVEL